MLATLLIQDLVGPRRLYLVDNSRHDVCASAQVGKVLKAMRRTEWHIEHRRSSASSPSAIKREALNLGDAPYLVLMDNDMLFTRGDTLSALKTVLDEYDVAAASPIARDLDDDRPMLDEYAAAYDAHPVDDRGVMEGDVALGICMAMRRDDLTSALPYWIDELPYLEDQVLGHFLKRGRGYAYLRWHSVLHVGWHESPSYAFDDGDVVRCLERRAARESAYYHLLELRRQSKDGAGFSRPIRRRQ